MRTSYVNGRPETNNDWIDGRYFGRGRGGEEEAALEEVLRVEFGAEVAAAVDDDGAPGDEGAAGRHAAATTAPGTDLSVKFIFPSYFGNFFKCYASPFAPEIANMTKLDL